MSFETDHLAERLVECLDENDDLKRDLDTWIDALEELSEIVDAFEIEDADGLHGKSILDVGTDCVKPLYIALKYEPDKIIGINQEPYSSASDIEQKSKLLTKTKIRFYTCNLFDEENLKKILKLEEVDRFDFIMVSKTLHHLRTGKECVANKRDQKHECQEDEKSCIYKFEKEKIFKLLFQSGKKVIIYEAFYPHEEDKDKVRGRGGHFTTEEWTHIFEHLSENYVVELIKPLRCHLSRNKLEKVKEKLKQVDYVCFYVEAK